MITLDGNQLPNGLIWEDEFTYSPVQQTTERGLTGSLIIDSGIKTKGRMITLAGDSDHGWIKRSVLSILYSLAESDIAHTLVLHDSRSFSVKWRHDDTPISAALILLKHNPGDDDYYQNLVLKFLEV